MYGKKQKLLCLFVVFSMIILILPGESYAAPTVEIIMNPSEANVPVGSKPIELTAIGGGENLKYTWGVRPQGYPGEFKGVSENKLMYIPPDNIDGPSVEMTLLVRVTEDYGQGQSAEASITFYLVSESKEGMSKETKIVIGVATVVILGGGIYCVATECWDGDDGDSDKNEPAIITITFPSNGSQVNRIETVYGTATGFSSGDRVALFVIPHGDQEYEQANRGIVDENGNWTVTEVVFGREGDIDSGKQFDLRAELRDESEQQVKASTTVTVTRQ